MSARISVAITTVQHDIEQAQLAEAQGDTRSAHQALIEAETECHNAARSLAAHGLHGPHNEHRQPAAPKIAITQAHYGHRSPVILGDELRYKAATVDVDGIKFSVSQYDDEAPEWGVDSIINLGGGLVFSHGEGDRTVHKQAISDPAIIAALEAARFTPCRTCGSSETSCGR